MLSNFRKAKLFPPINSNVNNQIQSMIKDKRGYMQAQMLYPNLSPKNSTLVQNPLKVDQFGRARN